jgi:hypothetical protein
MHVLIFGVGRSGTKAVQLYLSYLFAQKKGSAWVNYEPYFWLNRKTSIINYEGLYHHASSPHLARNPDRFTRRHRNFLQQLSKHDEDIVTKFIRGNGRIAAIVPMLQPDNTIVIVRDLYQVLTSVLRTNWDFLSVGFEYKLNWDLFMKEVRDSGLVDRLDWCDEQITDRLDRNAFYWYVMNLAALEYATEKTDFIEYSEISKIESLAKGIFGAMEMPSIASPMFNGDYIHGDYPLLSDNPRYSAKELLNGFLYKSQLTDKYGMYLSTRSVGDKVTVNDEYMLIESPEPKATKLSIEKKDLYEYFNQEISKKLALVKSNFDIRPHV